MHSTLGCAWHRPLCALEKQGLNPALVARGSKKLNEFQKVRSDIPTHLCMCGLSSIVQSNVLAIAAA